jgi:hypothetical protein
MTGPVVLVDRDGWLAPFWTVAEAQAGIELTDAEDGEYVAVDAAGRRVRVGVRRAAGAHRPRADIEVVVETTEDHVDEDEVRRLVELALPVEQRVGCGPGRRSLIDCFARLLHDRRADRIPRAAAERLRALLAEPPAIRDAVDRGPEQDRAEPASDRDDFGAGPSADANA